MGKHGLNSAGERLGSHEIVNTKALAVVLAGAALLGIAGCDGDTVPKDVRFAVSCSDPNNGNQAPGIDSIKQDSPYGEEATKNLCVLTAQKCQYMKLIAQQTQPQEKKVLLQKITTAMSLQ